MERRYYQYRQRMRNAVRAFVENRVDFARRSFVSNLRNSSVHNLNKNQIVQILNCQAWVYYKSRSTQKSALLFERSRRIQEQLFGQNDPRLAPVLYNLAAIYKRSNNFEKAVQLLEQVQSMVVSKKGRSNISYQLIEMELDSCRKGS